MLTLNGIGDAVIGLVVAALALPPIAWLVGMALRRSRRIESRPAPPPDVQ